MQKHTLYLRETTSTYSIFFSTKSNSSSKSEISTQILENSVVIVLKSFLFGMMAREQTIFLFLGRNLVIVTLVAVVGPCSIDASFSNSPNHSAVRNDQLLVKSAVLNCGKFGHWTLNGSSAGVGIPVAFPGTVIVTTVYHAVKKKKKKRQS